MPELPVLSARSVRAAFERAGWTFVRQRGSHMILSKAGSLATLSFPDHRELATGTLRKLIRLSGLSVSQFLELLR